jgi:homoserine O-acetyltransferase
MNLEEITEGLAASGVQHVVIDTPFVLECGAILPHLEIAYHTYGQLNAARNNVVWVCHALTGNSNAADWWSGLIGEGRLFDPRYVFVVCANMLGSCYGSSGPLTYNPATNEPYYLDFPAVTTRDMARAHSLLRRHLGVDRIALALGGSMGGQQVLEWAVLEPEVFECIVPMATNAQHSPWGIAFNETQRLALQADPTFAERHMHAGTAGMKAARAIGILSYRSYETFLATQSEPSLPVPSFFANGAYSSPLSASASSNGHAAENAIQGAKLDHFRASSYQAYQGEKLVKRFHAHSYWILSKAMDSHNLGRGRTSLEEALQSIRASALVIGISSDILFPPAEQRFLCEHLADAEYVEIGSIYGHDGFLVEFDRIRTTIEEFLCRKHPTLLSLLHTSRTLHESGSFA